MAVQVNTDYENTPFILNDDSIVQSGTIITDGARTAILKKYTVMAQIVASGKYTPFIALNATDGSSLPSAIYIGEDIAAAKLVAGDVVDVDFLVADAIIDSSKLVFDGGTRTLTHILNTTTLEARTVEKELLRYGIKMNDSVDISEYEN